MTGMWKMLCTFCKCSPTLVGAATLANCAIRIMCWYSVTLIVCFFFFSSADNTCFSSPETEEKKPQNPRSKEKSGKDDKKKTSLKHRESLSDSEENDNNSEATKESKDSDSGNKSHKWLKTQSSTSSLLPWITESSESTSSLFSIRKSTTSSSAAHMFTGFTSGTSIAKKQAAESKRKARTSDQHLSSEDEDPEDTLSSEFEDSDEELNTKGDITDIKTEIVKFFQTASVDEMSLISGCSVKKAQKILELRPFDSWRSLVREENNSLYNYNLHRICLFICAIITSTMKVSFSLRFIHFFALLAK